VAASAQHEVVEAARYVSQRSNNVAVGDALLERFYDSFALIAATPRLGTRRPEFGRGLRSHSVGNHLVFYRPHRDHVEITRVIHQRQDLRRAFARKQRRVALTPDFEQFVWARVDAGQYATAEAVLTACMEALVEREVVAHDFELWRAQVKLAEEQFERAGDSDRDGASARVRERFRSRKQPPG